MHEAGKSTSRDENPAYDSIFIEALDTDSEIPEEQRPDASFSGYERDYLFMNNNDGTFRDIAVGVGLDSVLDGRHVCSADFDADGDLDLIVVNLQNPRLLYFENVAPQAGSWIRVSLQGTKGNFDAIGALVTVHTDKGLQAQQVTAGDGYMVQHPKVLHFGLSADAKPQHIDILWPSGKTQILTLHKSETTIHIVEE